MSLIRLYERKRHNYLLRSTRSYDVVRFAILVREGRVQIDEFGIAAIYSKYGTWIAHCGEFADMLLNQGLAEIVRGYPLGLARDEYVLTGEGYRCLDGALRVDELETMSVLRDVDERLNS